MKVVMKNLLNRKLIIIKIWQDGLSSNYITNNIISLVTETDFLQRFKRKYIK